MTRKKASITCSFLFGLLCIAVPFSHAHATPEPTHKKPRVVWLNVFVHGIMSIKPHISWNNFMLFMKDQVGGTLYEKTVELMREDPFFYKNQAMQRLGLHRVQPLPIKGDSSSTFAFTLNEIGKHYGVNKHDNRYYTFGWSGLLSAKSRYQEAQRLFKELHQEIKRLRAENITPRIRLFGYSHGGNVCLNLGLIRQKEYSGMPFTVDETVLLGTPIINDTDYLTTDPLFKRVYNLYSLRDRIQPMDMFAPNQFFSNRIFRARKDFKLPNKLIQIQLKVTRCTRNTHNCPKRFLQSSNFSRPQVVYGKSGLLRDISPGHVELWFFGWTPVNYRSCYPLNPLPTIAFAPIILHHAKKIAKSITPEHAIVADIRPQHEVILFRKDSHSSPHSTVPYMPKAKLDTLHDAIHKCKPDLYSDKIYKAHINDAVSVARKALEISRE